MTTKPSPSVKPEVKAEPKLESKLDVKSMKADSKPRINPGSSLGTQTLVALDQSHINPVFSALMIVGIFIAFALSETQMSSDGTTGPATALIWGYGIVVFSLMGMILVNADPGSDEWSDLLKLPWIVVLTIGILVWTIILNIQYYKQINSRNVPEEYLMWSKYSIYLILCVVFVACYQYMIYKSEKNDHKVSDSLLVYSVIAIVFNVIAVSIQQVILSCFYVDG